MSKQNPQSKLYRYGFFISLLVSVVVIVSLYLIGRDKPSETQFYSVASSLAASVAFAVLYTFFANAEFLRIVQDRVSEGHQEMVDLMLEELRRFHVAYSPAAVFPPTLGVDTHFNNALSGDLRGSTLYVFRGVSAKYVPARIRHSSHHLSILRVILCDPRDHSALRLRAQDRSSNPKYQAKSMDQLIDGIRDEIFMSIVALFDSRQRCTIELAYEVGTSVARLEIFDNALYLSLYHTERSEKLSFPETLRYEKEAMLYNLYRMDTFREYDISKHKITFTADTSFEALQEHLQQLGMQNASWSTIDSFRNRYNRFCQKFIEESGIGK